MVSRCPEKGLRLAALAAQQLTIAATGLEIIQRDGLQQATAGMNGA